MKVGDYVRTPQGIIAKIVNIQEDTRQYFLNGNAVSLESKNYIADKNITIGENFKHSPKIIDLIQVGDYVNGEKVCYLKGQINEKEIAHKEDVLYTEYVNEYGEWYGYEEDEIKSIVTKEMYSSVEYKVENN